MLLDAATSNVQVSECQPSETMCSLYEDNNNKHFLCDVANCTTAQASGYSLLKCCGTAKCNSDVAAVRSPSLTLAVAVAVTVGAVLAL